MKHCRPAISSFRYSSARSSASPSSPSSSGVRLAQGPAPGPSSMRRRWGWGCGKTTTALPGNLTANVAQAMEKGFSQHNLKKRVGVETRDIFMQPGAEGGLIEVRGKRERKEKGEEGYRETPPSHA